MIKALFAHGILNWINWITTQTHELFFLNTKQDAENLPAILMISCLVPRAFSLVGNMKICLRTSRITSVPDRKHLPTVDSDMWILSPISYRYVPVAKDLRHSKSCNMGVVHSGFFLLSSRFPTIKSFKWTIVSWRNRSKTRHQ